MNRRGVARPALLSSLVVAFLGLSSSAAAQRALSFDERVAAQEAIERVYHSYVLGDDRLFEEAVPREVLEDQVRHYLAQSTALRRFWHVPSTFP